MSRKKSFGDSGFYDYYGERLGGEALDFGFKKRQMRRKILIPKKTENMNIERRIDEFALF